MIGNYDIPSVEISLSDFYKENFDRCKSDVEFLRSRVPVLIDDLNLKQWLFHPDLKLFKPPDLLVTRVQSKVEIIGRGSNALSGMDKLVIGGVITSVALMVSPMLRGLIRGVFRFISRKPRRAKSRSRRKKPRNTPSDWSDKNGKDTSELQKRLGKT